jgi:hypothetical protein
MANETAKNFYLNFIHAIAIRISKPVFGGYHYYAAAKIFAACAD